MSFCENCGRTLPDNSNVCPNCPSPTPQGGAVAATAIPTGTGLSPTTAGALSYLAGFITGIIFLLIDPFKAHRFVRFHAFQSIFFNIAWIGLWIAWMILGLVLSAITKGIFFFIQMPIDLLVMVGGFCLWAYLMYSASQGKIFKLPIIGALAAKQAGM